MKNRLENALADLGSQLVPPRPVYSERLMKVTGDIKALPYRDLMKLAFVLGARADITASELAEDLLSAAEEINP